MLINMIKESYRDMVGHTDPIQTTVTVPENQPAANASSFSQSEMQARRQRRERRMGRVSQSGNLGWRVRAW